MVMFPKVVIPITAGREKSIKLLEEAQKNGQLIGILSQKLSQQENPTEKDLYQIGTIAKIIKIIKLPDGNISAITRGVQRFKVKNFIETEPYFTAEIEKLKDYLIWREKEFVEKYEGTRHNTENDSYANFEGKKQDGSIVLALINTTLIQWDKKASHPWVFIVAITFDDCNNGGLPDEKTYKLLDKIEEEIIQVLPDSDGYLNIGRETANNKRELFFACKDSCLCVVVLLWDV